MEAEVANSTPLQQTVPEIMRAMEMSSPRRRRQRVLVELHEGGHAGQL
jgi:hypothetical protein